MTTPPSLLTRFRSGDTQALARLLTLVEDDHPSAGRILAEIFPSAGKGCRVGITGAPGAGKSTLVSHLAALWCDQGETVAVLAMDPTSPFSGGALLGDRVRFETPAGQKGTLPVFFRSAASRGHTGGLAQRTEEMSVVLDAFGYGRLLIESVGVGQVGLDIAEACDTTIVVMVPESGDDVQALKAGLLEIADIAVVNKADRPGAVNLRDQMREAFHLRTAAGKAEPPVLLTHGRSGEGVAELAEAVNHHQQAAAHENQQTMRRDRTRRGLLNLVREELRQAVTDAFKNGQFPGGKPLEPVLEEVLAGRRDPFGVAREIVAELLGGTIKKGVEK